MDERTALALTELCRRYGRLPTLTLEGGGTPEDGTFALVFDPPLTATEQAVFDDLSVMATLGLQTLTLAEYRARKADIADIKVQLTNLAQWLALPTGTAKTNNAIAAEQAIGTALTELARVVGALLKVDLS